MLSTVIEWNTLALDAFFRDGTVGALQLSPFPRPVHRGGSVHHCQVRGMVDAWWHQTGSGNCFQCSDSSEARRTSKVFLVMLDVPADDPFLFTDYFRNLPNDPVTGMTGRSKSTLSILSLLVSTTVCMISYYFRGRFNPRTANGVIWHLALDIFLITCSFLYLYYHNFLSFPKGLSTLAKAMRINAQSTV